MSPALPTAILLLAVGVSVAHAEEPPPWAASVRHESVRAVYLSSHAAAGKTFDHLLDRIGTTELNAFVIDLKDANGRLSFTPSDPTLKPYAPKRPTIPDLEERVQRVRDRGGFTIARFSVFQDTSYAERNPADAIKRSDGRTIWRDGIGGAWLDPTSRRVWVYAAALSREAKAQGFDEVNLDYIRFPSDGPEFSSIRYPHWDGKTLKRHVIQAFAVFIDREVRQQGIPVSADLFGLVFWAKGDLGIGQNLEDLAPYFDVLAPMVYPSHYRRGFLGKANPARFPYEVIRATLDRGRERLAAIPEDRRPIVRPWIQDFDLGAPYGDAEVRREQEASTDAGAVGWMIWNPRGRYSEGAFQ